MSRVRAIANLFFLLAALPSTVFSQQEPDWDIQGLRDTPGGGVVWHLDTGLVVATNGVLVRYGQAVLTAEQVSVNQATGEVVADGRVRIQQGEQVWASEHIRYNFKTREIQAEQFRTGQSPFFAAGEGLHADISNRVYTATNALISSEDLSHPLLKVRASRIRIVPGKKVTARDATLYVGKVPVFYFPYYSRNIGPNANNLNVTPGYRSTYGAYALGTYTFFLNEHLDGVAHLDYRSERGPGAGPDLNYHFGKWGEGTFRYYYTHDQDPDINVPGLDIPQDRQRVWFSYQANPATNLQALSVVRYQSDLAIVRDFYEGEYRQNPQPNTFVEVNKFWDNFSLDLYVQPQVNDFLETVERLPEVRLTGFRQRLGETPLFYESQSSVGYYQRKFAEDTGIYGSPPGLDYAAGRGDTYHQILIPQTFFGWLNVTPRIGGRLSYYTEADGPGAVTEETHRGVFNTGVETTFKISRVWPGYRNHFFDMDGARHIMEPMVNYVYVPRPNVQPYELPQFDYEFPTLRLLPIDFPDYNSIDSIDSQNAVRLGLRNRLQTKREKLVTDVVYWDVYTDWRMRPREDQSTFPDLFSDLILRPRSWLRLESLTRYDFERRDFRLALHSLRLTPNNTWSWGLTHFYLRDDLSTSVRGLGVGNNSLLSTIFYRLNENWGFRASHYYNIRDGRVDEQFYSIYRDLRSWTAALTVSLRQSRVAEDDIGVAFTFSLKAFPRFGVGADSVAPYTLLGS